jgi:Fe-S-cluster containining protein
MSECLNAKAIRDEVIHYTCVSNCFGKRDNAAGCCKIAERDFIIGPIDDAQEFLKRLNSRDKAKYKFTDIFIEYKEGSKLFPGKTSWQEPSHYPALRLQMNDSEFPCNFLSEKRECSVYEIRPKTCRNYLCEHLTKLLDLL